jgi:hypothetical protein
VSPAKNVFACCRTPSAIVSITRFGNPPGNLPLTISTFESAVATIACKWSVAEAIAIFETVGLAGPFWSLESREDSF